MSEFRITPPPRPGLAPVVAGSLRIAGSNVKGLREVQSLQRPPVNSLNFPTFASAILSDSDKPVLTSFSVGETIRTALGYALAATFVLGVGGLAFLFAWAISAGAWTP